MNSAARTSLLSAIVGGAVRVGTPFLFVSLGECLTEKSGRINLGLEGGLVLAARAGFGGAYLTGCRWLGVLLAGVCGAPLALLHGPLCSLPRVSDTATGIALMLLGTGLAFYLCKPLIQPQAPQIPALALGGWSTSQQVQSALSGHLLRDRCRYASPPRMVRSPGLSSGFRRRGRGRGPQAPGQVVDQGDQGMRRDRLAHVEVETCRTSGVSMPGDDRAVSATRNGRFPLGPSRMALAASKPSIWGIAISRNTMSGSKRAVSSTASGALSTARVWWPRASTSSEVVSWRSG